MATATEISAVKSAAKKILKKRLVDLTVEDLLDFLATIEERGLLK